MIKGKIKKVVDKYSTHFKNLYYRKFPNVAIFTEKAIKIFTLSEYDKKYDYIWLVKDRVSVSENIVKRILATAENNNPDVIFLRAIEANHTINLATENYDNPIKFYHDWAWLVTSFDCTLLSTKTILSNINWSEIIELYTVNEEINYILVVLLFNEIVKYKNCRVSVLNAGAGEHIFNLPKKNSIQKKSDSILFDVWGKQWHHVNMNLPDIYNSEKEFAIKSATSLPWILGDQIRLMSIWKSGNLTDEKLECVKDIWSEISDIPWEDVCRIKDGDMEFMRTCFIDKTWEHVSNGNMNQVLNDYTDFQWLIGDEPNDELQNTIYMIEIFLYELQNNNVHIFDGGTSKEYIFAKLQLAINFMKILEENDNVQSDEFKAVIENKIISVSMMEYFIVKLCKNPELVAERFNAFVTGDKVKVTEIENEIINTAEKDSLCYYRKQVLDIKKDSVEATIVIVAYNRLDITKLCVESVLKYTDDIKYKLVLVYNRSTQGVGISEYFKSVPYDNKVVIELENNGAAYAYREAEKYFEGNYIVHLPNDVIVTSNWLSNLIECAKSDPIIGMVNPVTSNVSNLQQVNLEFNDYEEMQQKAAEYNVSDPTKWHERIRLVTLGTLFTRECLSAIGPVFDIGFIHDFGDDDVSFRVRRAGYKTILAKDTWLHHAHDVAHMESKDPQEFQRSLENGRKNFKEKYFGIDAWDDVNNFVFPYIENKIDMPQDIENVDILGVDVKCGTPILDMKNAVKKYGIFNVGTSAFTTESKYDIDLRTICNGDVICDRIEYLKEKFENRRFDYIIMGNSINSYRAPVKLIKNLYSLLNEGGQIFINLKNTYSIMSFASMMGYSVGSDEMYEHISLDTLCSQLKDTVNSVNLINYQQHNVGNEIIQYAHQVIKYAKSGDSNEEELLGKLMIDKYWIKISK